MNFGINSLNLPADNLSNNIGFTEKGEFSHIQQGGNLHQALGPLTEQAPQETSDINNYMQLAMNQVYQNALVESFGHNPGNCTNKSLKNQNTKLCNEYKPSDDKDGMLKAMHQNIFSPQMGPNGQLVVPALQQGNQGINHYIGKLMLDKFRNNQSAPAPGAGGASRQAGGGQYGGGQYGGFPNIDTAELGNMFLHNAVMGAGTNGFAMPNAGFQSNMGQNRSIISNSRNNTFGRPQIPSSLSSMESSYSSASSASSDSDSSDCSSKISKGSCRRPSCFATGTFNSPGRQCLPTKGVTQPCPPSYRNGRGNSCVPRTMKQLRAMSNGSPRRSRSAKSSCVEVNRGAKQAHDEFVTSNCVEPGCSVRKVKGKLQCHASRK